MALSNNDLANIENLFKAVLDEELDNKLDSKLGKYPTKDEFFEREDKLMKELKIIREEVTILSDHSSTHSDRIDKLERRVANKFQV